jgi:hypothetical protein
METKRKYNQLPTPPDLITALDAAKYLDLAYATFKSRVKMFGIEQATGPDPRRRYYKRDDIEKLKELVKGQ